MLVAPSTLGADLILVARHIQCQVLTTCCRTSCSPHLPRQVTVQGDDVTECTCNCHPAGADMSLLASFTQSKHSDFNATTCCLGLAVLKDDLQMHACSRMAAGSMMAEPSLKYAYNPDGRRSMGPKDVSASTSIGRFTAERKGSFISACAFQTDVHPPPPISTAPDSEVTSRTGADFRFPAASSSQTCK